EDLHENDPRAAWRGFDVYRVIRRQPRGTGGQPQCESDESGSDSGTDLDASRYDVCVLRFVLVQSSYAIHVSGRLEKPWGLSDRHGYQYARRHYQAGRLYGSQLSQRRVGDSGPAET